jgi:hypothetical protein
MSLQPCVLCLHGSQQTSEIFRSKLGGLVGKLRKICKTIFIEGPHECELREGDEVHTRTWYVRDKQSHDIIPTSLDISLDIIENIWKENHNNIIGVIGEFNNSIHRYEGILISLLLPCRIQYGGYISSYTSITAIKIS